MSRIPEVKDRVFLNIDRYEAVDMVMIRQDFFDMVGGVKLGIRFLSAPLAPQIRRGLIAHGLKLFIDSKLEESENQMPDTVRDYEKDGYNYFSISGIVEEEAMIAASRAAKIAKPVVTLARHQPHLIDDQLRKIHEINNSLDNGDKIEELLLDVNDLERVRADSAAWMLTATGIYVPDTVPPEGPRRLLPAEAFEAGADRIALGSTVFGAGDKRIAAMERVLANCY